MGGQRQGSCACVYVGGQRGSAVLYCIVVLIIYSKHLVRVYPKCSRGGTRSAIAFLPAECRWQFQLERAAANLGSNKDGRNNQIAGGAVPANYRFRYIIGCLLRFSRTSITSAGAPVLRNGKICIVSRSRTSLCRSSWFTYCV